jgi:hypothetical protein
MDPELQKQYSPSLWNKRHPPESIVQIHGDFMAQSMLKKMLT